MAGSKNSIGVTVRKTIEFRQATEALRSGDVAKARKFAAALGRSYPDSVDLFSLRAAIDTAAKDYGSARRHIEAAELIEPFNVGVLAYKAHTLSMLRDFAEALRVADKAMGLGSDESDVMATLGSVYTKCGEYEKSQHCFRIAVEFNPDNPVHNYNLGTALRFSGDFAGAEKCFDRAIALRPGDYETYFARSGLRRQTDQNNHVAQLETLLQRKIADWRNEMFVCYALAKELEDLRDWDRSFHYLRRGADLKRAHMQYDVRTDVRKIEKVRSAFTPEVLASTDGGFSSNEPIFVVGLPRAGSTLVERILSSHASVVSAGELQNFAIEMMRPIYARLQTTQVPIETMIEHSLNLDFAALGRAYRDSAQHVAGGSARFVDKMPMNFLYTGLIHLALPNAKIVHVHRGSMDACYAMYKMMFKGAYPFSYDLDDLGRYYVAYHRLMEHWNQCLGKRLFNLRYEDLITNQKAITEKLLKYCELEWQDACMDFHRLKTPSTTASAVDVRKPLYSSSVGKWQHFRSHLASLEAYLQGRGVSP